MIRFLSTITFFAILSTYCVAQNIPASIVADPDFAQSAEPKKLTGYTANLGIVNGTALSSAGCVFDWKATNVNNYSQGVEIPFNNLGIAIPIAWDNYNANAVLKFKSKNCNNSASNDREATYSVPIRYLGPAGSISMNSSSNNPGSLNCGIQTVTFTTPNVTNATSYTWDASDITSKGWVYLGGQGTTTLTLQSSPGTSGIVKMRATRADVTTINSESPNFQLNRPSPSSNFAFIGGLELLCNGQSGGYSINGLGTGASVSYWVVSPEFSYSGSGNSITVSYANNGRGFVRTVINDVCVTSPVVVEKFVYAGTPNLQLMTYGTAGSGQGTLSTVNFVSSNTWYIIRSNANDAFLTTSINWFFPNGQPGNVNGYTGGANNVDFNLNLSPGQSVAFNTIQATNSCGTQTRNVTFTTGSGFRAYPNPAKEELTVEFDNTTYQEALPDALEIVSEKQMKTVRTVNVQEVFARKAFKAGKQIEFDIRDLPRGVYYLKVTNPRQEKEKQVEMVRLVFE